MFEGDETSTSWHKTRRATSLLGKLHLGSRSESLAECRAVQVVRIAWKLTGEGRAAQRALPWANECGDAPADELWFGIERTAFIDGRTINNRCFLSLRDLTAGRSVRGG